ncbi:MAG: DUF86 domain-containing protein [Nanoarchaeota archaeon]|nr:DUF86 domain-containing protein [Nanoarchaeota archaeon]MBU1004415.1 DUF86 domain-containing protein [Nanoarchaeota archaeon]MBU1946698.1 DUF86 domain-containing protein [Nanoarchaeota archaeon]
MKRDYNLFIKDIIAAMESIEEFVGSMALEELKADEKTSSAVIRKFEIIGEAAKHIPSKIKDNYKEIQWKSMAGMRDRLIHAYFGIDYNLVWSAMKTEIPSLKPKLKKIVSELEQEEK